MLNIHPETDIDKTSVLVEVWDKIHHSSGNRYRTESHQWLMNGTVRSNIFYITYNPLETNDKKYSMEVRIGKQNECTKKEEEYFLKNKSQYFNNLSNSKSSFYVFYERAQRLKKALEEKFKKMSNHDQENFIHTFSPYLKAIIEDLPENIRLKMDEIIGKFKEWNRERALIDELAQKENALLQQAAEKEDLQMHELMRKGALFYAKHLTELDK